MRWYLPKTVTTPTVACGTVTEQPQEDHERDKEQHQDKRTEIHGSLRRSRRPGSGRHIVVGCVTTMCA